MNIRAFRLKKCIIQNWIYNTARPLQNCSREMRQITFFDTNEAITVWKLRCKRVDKNNGYQTADLTDKIVIGNNSKIPRSLYKKCVNSIYNLHNKELLI